MSEQNAFTLAEVLITLVIIGVIAAMTIPTLINKTNKQEYASKLKKTYSTMSQATQKIIADNGMPRGDIGGWATSAEAVFNMYKNYLSNAKVCGIDTTGCFAGTYKRMNGTTTSTFDDINRYRLVIADGTEISVAEGDFHNDCTNITATAGTNNFCQHILIDVNGAKGPNAIGIDTFGFCLKEVGLVPTGCDYDACNKSMPGWGCTCKVLREGAINY